MQNQALMNLEQELKKDENNLKQKETASKEAHAKATSLEAEIRSHEQEIQKLEQDIKTKKPEIKKQVDLHQKLETEIRVLRQKREQDHLTLTKITRDTADAVRKAQQEAKTHSQTRFN